MAGDTGGSDVSRALAGVDHRLVHFGAGSTIVAEGDPSDDVLLIESGSVEISAGGMDHVLACLGPGDVIGEVAALAGGGRTATAVAVTPVSARMIERAAFDTLLEIEPAFARRVVEQAADRIERRHMLAFLERLFGHLDSSVITEFEDAIQWVDLRSGDVLFAEGDMADAGYFLISGRLHEFGTDVDGEPALLREIARDELVGESGLFRGAPRETTVVASRDCRLVRITLDRFLLLINRHPAILVPVVTDLARRTPGTRKSNRQRTIGLCITGDVDRRVFASRLVEHLERHGSTSHLWSARVDSVLGREGIARSGVSQPGDARVAELLHELELDHTYLVCEADPEPTEWTDRVGRQSDVQVAVVEPGLSERARNTIDRFFSAGGGRTQRIAVVVHPVDTALPRGMRALIDRWPDAEIINVRAHSTRDIGRLSRILSGQPTGLVLGGGGARGFAHLGVCKALDELGIDVDLVGGSSIGAPLGATLALELTPAEHIDLIADGFTGLLDYTIPVVSLVKGERITTSIERTFDGVEFEDLWKTFFCVSTNLTRAREVVHDTGDLVRALRASVAIPGVIPPVAAGEDLLVDGGVLNNLPADVMRKRNPTGTVIAVDVAPPTGPRAGGDTSLSVSGWQALRSMASKSRNEFPGIAAMLLRTMITASVRERARTLERGDVDLYLDLDLRGVSLLDFERVRPVAQAGYEAAMPRLEAWLKTRREG